MCSTRKISHSRNSAKKSLLGAADVADAAAAAAGAGSDAAGAAEAAAAAAGPGASVVGVRPKKVKST
jgi:hypothetical protein